MDESSVIILAITTFNAVFSLGFLYIWFRARRLRDALTGQEGWQLMSIFCRVLLVTGLTLVLSAMRQVLFLVAPAETELLRYAVALGSTLAIVGVFVWAFLEVRRLINTRRDANGDEPLP